MARSSQLQIRVSPAQKAAIRRGARSAGVTMSQWVLARTLPSARADFEAVIGRLSRTDGGASRTLAALNDLLSDLPPAGLAEAIADPPGERLSAFHHAYVAAMVEYAAYRARIPVPHWVQHVGAVRDPYFASTLVSLRLHLLRASPPPFRRRNIFIDATLGDRV